ncbi:MAG: hypothetical protein R2880_03800 [Deinococcales bacterium]
MGLNVWQTRAAPQASDEALGLDHYVLKLGDEEAFRALALRMSQELPVGEKILQLRDPAGNKLHVIS